MFFPVLNNEEREFNNLRNYSVGFLFDMERSQEEHSCSM